MTERPKKAPEQRGEDDLAVLFPDRQATIAGVAVTMREYRWVEGMRLQMLLAPIVERLADLAEQGSLADAAAHESLFADASDVLPLLISTACDQPLEWVESLSDRDGRNLRLLWWAVNLPFFVPRVSDRLLARQLASVDGAKPSTSSSQPGTEHRTSSGNTRAVN